MENTITDTSKINFYLQTAIAYTIEEKEHQGANHLVIPVIMMVEGVHSGSAGPLFHSIAELGKFPESWNGIPVVIDHPSVDGRNISANSPDVIDTRTVGRVYNTYVDGDKLKAEVWLNEDALRQVSSVTLASIRESEVIEVSVGVFTEEIEEEGTWNNEEYKAMAINHRPDHLALLPGGTGACSVEDGCGLGLNKKKGDTNVKEEKKVLQTMRDLKKVGFSVTQVTDNTSEGLVERLEALRRKIDNMDTQDTYHWLQEAYDDYVVYEARLRIGDSKLYKQAYSMSANGEIELVGDPEEVQREVTYVSINASPTKTKPKKEVKIMSKVNDCPRCLEKVAGLIANEQSKFTEDDREWLLTQEEAQLDKFEPNVVEPIEKIVEKEVEVNVLSDEDKNALAFGKRQLAERRATMIKGVQDNTEAGIWDEPTLTAMDESTLERVFKSVQKEAVPVVDYSIQSTPVNTNVGKVAPMMPAGFEVNETKKEDK